jgi:hypothetical protein
MEKKLVAPAIWEFLEHALKKIFITAIKHVRANKENAKQYDLGQRTCRHVNSNINKINADALLMKNRWNSSHAVIAASNTKPAINELAGKADMIEPMPKPISIKKVSSYIKNISINNKNVVTKKLATTNKEYNALGKKVARVSAKTTSSQKNSRLAIQKVVNASKANKVLNKAKTNNLIKKVSTPLKTKKTVINKVSNKNKTTNINHKAAGSIKSSKNKKPKAVSTRNYRTSMA